MPMSDVYEQDTSTRARATVEQIIAGRHGTRPVVEVDCRHLFDDRMGIDASIARLDTMLSAIEDVPSIRIVIFSGLDVPAEAAETILSTDQFRRWNKLLARTGGLHAITIGTTMERCSGRAFQVALCCDFRICTPSARFSCMEARTGHLPGLSTYRLPTLVGHGVAKRMILAGEACDATRALAVGLVDDVVAADDIDDDVDVLADQLLSANPVSVSLARRLINEAHATQPDAVLGHQLAAYHCCMEAMSP